MDTKKMIEKLVKIAESQQKIINKIAQSLPEEMSKYETPPNELKPNPTQKEPAKIVFEALDDKTKATVDSMFTAGGDMFVKFFNGQGNQANYNAVLNVLKDLTKKGRIQQAYALKMAD